MFFLAVLVAFCFAGAFWFAFFFSLRVVSSLLISRIKPPLVDTSIVVEAAREIKQTISMRSLAVPQADHGSCYSLVPGLGSQGSGAL